MANLEHRIVKYYFTIHHNEHLHNHTLWYKKCKVPVCIQVLVTKLVEQMNFGVNLRHFQWWNVTADSHLIEFECDGLTLNPSIYRLVRVCTLRQPRDLSCGFLYPLKKISYLYFNRGIQIIGYRYLMSGISFDVIHLVHFSITNVALEQWCVDFLYPLFL